jgi:hypothetical protein
MILIYGIYIVIKVPERSSGPVSSRSFTQRTHRNRLLCGTRWRREAFINNNATVIPAVIPAGDIPPRGAGVDRIGSLRHSLYSRTILCITDIDFEVGGRRGQSP